jgi:hypothetical protein
LDWSKIPFAALERSGRLDPRLMATVRDDFDDFCGRVSGIGFNGVTLDDLPHLARFSGYTAERSSRIEDYRREWRCLFEIAGGHGLQVFLTTDVMFWTPELERRLGTGLLPHRRFSRVVSFLREACAEVLDSFPQVRGLILRIGECDALDHAGDFASRLTVRSPRQMRELLSALLPVFEARSRLLIARTWCVGAYPIGDLIWNRDTFDRSFRGIDSPNLVLSMKYGESDFYRYLPLSKHFFRSRHRKLVELQARREYEGCGEFPSFIGRQYTRYRDQLAAASNVVGISVWCQTGGWTRFRRLAFLGPRSREAASATSGAVWNEINAEVALRVFRGEPAAAVVSDYCVRRGEPQRAAALFELLELSEQVVEELLYIADVARQKLFFRRLRVPPLLSVFWDTVLVNDAMRQVLRALVRDPRIRILEAELALAKLRRMIDLAPAAGMPTEDLVFQHDTFEILAAARRYYFGEFETQTALRLEKLRDRYEARFPDRHYRVLLDFRPLRLRSRHVRRLLALVLRRRRGYRVVDRLITLRLLSWVYPLLRPFSGRLVPKVARETAMGIDTLLR